MSRDPHIMGLLNRPAQRLGDHAARLAIRERTPAFGSSASTTIIDATLPIGSGAEITQEDVDTIGIRQAGTDDAMLRIIPSAGNRAAVQFYDGATGMWNIRKEVDNSLTIRDVVTGTAVMTYNSNTHYFQSTRQMYSTTTNAAITADGPVDFTAPDPQVKFLASATSFLNFNNGARGDQLYNDETNGPSFTSCNLYQTKIPSVFNAVGTLQGFASDLTAAEIEAPISLTGAVTSTGASGAGKTITLAAPHGYQIEPSTVATTAGSNTLTGTSFTLTVESMVYGPFPTAGTLFIGANSVTYTGRTSTTFTGCSLVGGGSVPVAAGTTVHLFRTSGVVTISGCTGSFLGLNGTWWITNITATAFDVSWSPNPNNGAITHTSGSVQRHLYHDIDAFHGRLVLDSPGGNACCEGNLNINLGCWGKAIYQNILVRDQNTYESYKWIDHPTNTKANQVWVPTSYYPHQGATGLGVFTVPTSPQGQPGTAIAIGAVSGCPEFKRSMVISDGFWDNTMANEKFVIEPGDAYSVRVGIGNAAAVNQTANPIGLTSRLVIAPIDTPTDDNDGMMFGNTATAVRVFRDAPDRLKLLPGDGAGPAALWVTGELTVGTGTTAGTIASYATDGSGHIILLEQTAVPPTAANAGKLYCDDDGAGKTRLNVMFSGGIVRTIAQQDGLIGWGVGTMTGLAPVPGTPTGTGIWMDTRGEINSVCASGPWLKCYANTTDTQPTCRIAASGEYRIGRAGAATCTVTIASPAVFGSTGHPYVAGDKVVFSTTGALPTGLTAGTNYYVLSPITDFFQVSASPPPSTTAVNTSGSQSGVHSVQYAQDVGFARTGAGVLTTTDGSAGGLGISRAGSFQVAGTGGLGFIQWAEQATATVAAGTANTRVRAYMTGDKFVLVFDNAGTVRYFTLDLTQTGATATWAQSTTAP